jgi:hypothetical protein
MQKVDDLGISVWRFFRSFSHTFLITGVIRTDPDADGSGIFLDFV